MKRKTKNPALLFIMTMFAFFGMLSVEAKEVTTSDFNDFDEAVRSADVDTINITGNMTMVTTVFDRKQQSDNLTINGNNFTITAADDLRYSNGVFNNNGKNLTINDLTLENFTPRVWSTGVDSSDSTIFNQVKGSLTLSNVTIQNNTNTTLSSNSDLTISNSKFLNNKYVKSTAAGGAITTNKKDSTISNTLFQGNKSLKNGGAILHKGPLLTLTGGSFEDNEATEMGGAICANSYAKLDIDGTSFKNNTSATKDGGAIAINNSTTSVIKNASFDGNKALGTNAAGGAIALIKGTLDIDNTNFTNNQSNYGGAVYQYTNKNVSMDIKNSTFDSNIAKNGGGALGIFKEAKISGSKFLNNKAETEDGGAIFLGSESVTNIDNTIFNGNTAATDGGAITTRDYNANNSAAKLDIVNSTFKSNTATTNGGAINNYFYISAENGEFVTIKDTSFDGNSAKNGGAIYNHGVADLNGKYGSIKADNVTFTNNTASNYGGAIYNEGNLDISNSKFNSNKAGNWGGAIYANTTVTNASGTKENNGGVINISNTEFDGNSASIGGAIFLHNGTMNITNSKFTNNSADYSGAIFTGSTEHAILNISDSLFEGNTAKGVGAVQGMSVTSIKNTIFRNNTATEDEDGAGALFLGAISNTKIGNSVDNSLFENNTSATRGGAISTRSQIANNKDASLDIINTKFTGNKAGTTGGAIDNYFYNSSSNEGYVTVKGSEFTDNYATDGGAIYNHGELDKNNKMGSIKVENSIFKNNQAKKYGGAIYNVGNLEIKNSKFINNAANIAGGAIANMKGGFAKIIDSIFSGNTANGEKNDIHNEGEITFVGNNTLDGGIDGNGSAIVQDGANVDIANGKLVQDSVNVETNGSLITNVANTTVTNGITNNGSVTFTGSGELNTVLSGNGSLVLTPDGTITLNNLSLIGSVMPVTVTGGEFAIGNNITNFDNKLTMGNATLNLINGVDNVISDLNVEDGKEMKLAIDFNDKIETADVTAVQGDIVLNKIDISSITVNSTNTLSTTLGNYISYDKDTQLVNGNGSVNFVTFSQVDPNSVILTAAKSTLNGAVADTSDQRVYDMESSETVSSNTSVGTLVIQGNGQTISSDPTDIGGGIQIGSIGANSGDLSLVDTNIDSIIVNDDKKGALTVNGESGLVIEAKNHDVTIQNTKGNSVNNAIYLNDEANGEAIAALIAHNGKSITIQDDIRSNHANNKILLQGNGNIHLNGVLDPLTVDTTAANVYRNGYDEAITWNLNGGTVHYSKDSYLYDAAHHTTALMNTLNFNGGALDLRNGAANTINLAALNLNATSNIYLDVDLANKTMDKIEAPTTVNNGTLNVAGFQLLSDAIGPETTINFTTDEALKGSVQYTGAQELQALSPVYKYNVKYLANSGDFNFSKNVAPNPYLSYNPAVFGSSIAMQGVYMTQLANYDIAFSNLDQKMLMTQEQRNALKYGNKYAANDETTPQVYSPLYIPEENAGIWFRPYASFEQVQLENGPDVNNVMYGSLVGGDTELLSLGKGWDGQFSAYIGYNGSHQTFDGVGIYQNGGMAGLTAALYKGNFFEAITANFGANSANIKTNVGSNDFVTLATGVSSKTGYNWELAKGKFIIQPSWTMSYTFVGPLDDYTLGNGVNINTDNLNAIQLAPGLKFIGNLPHGWQPYLSFKMLWNIIDESKVKAGFVNIPETSIKPYFEYGLGVQKAVGERFTCFEQTMFRAGGRNGVSLTLGARYAIGELADKHQTKAIQKSSRANRIKQISTDEN